MKKEYLILLCVLVFSASNMYAQNWRNTVKQIGNAAQDIANERARAKEAKKKAEAEAASSGGIAKTAKTILKIGESYKLKIKPSSEMFPQFGLGGRNTVYNDFKIVTIDDGSLTLSFETFTEMTQLALYNENGSSLEPASKDIISGNNRWNNISRVGVLELQWNTTVEKFVGSFTWKLDTGTYYLRIVRGQKGLSNLNLSLVFKNLDGDEVK